MNLKKLMCLLLALAMVFALAACSGKEDNGDSDETEPDSQTPSESGGEDEAPDYSALSEGLDENGFFEGVRALDSVVLPDPGSLVEPEFPKLTDRAVEDGDFVNIDYVGSVDGVEFDGGSTNGAGSDVIIGVTSFIDDFLAQIVGHKPGENFDIEVTFPDPYQSEELAGKDAVFNITVNYIWEVTDEAAQAIGFDGRDDMAQYVATNYASVEDVVSDPGVTLYLTAAQCDEIPASVTDTVRAQLTSLVNIQASQYGVDAATLVSLYGAPSVEEYVNAQVPGQARLYLIFQAVAEQADISVTDEDIAEREYESYVDLYGMPYVKYTISQEKAIAYINTLFE